MSIQSLPLHMTSEYIMVSRGGRPFKFDEPTVRREIRFPETLNAQLTEIAREKGEDVSDLVRMAVKQALLDEPVEPVTALTLEQLRRELKEVFSEVVPARAHASDVRRVRETMKVPCGEPREMHYLVNEMGEGEWVDVGGVLAGLVTPNTYIARADGLSMNGHCDDSITNGDRLLMTPIEEYSGEIKSGTIVLVKLVYKGGAEKYTLKTCLQTGARKKITAKNPRFSAPEFGGKLEYAEVVAVCRGVVEKVFG